jgi:hypothetical protein
MPTEDLFLPLDEAAEFELVMPIEDLFLPAEAGEFEPIMLIDDMFLPADATEFEEIWDENWDGSGTALFMEEGEMGNETGESEEKQFKMMKADAPRLLQDLRRNTDSLQ